MQIEPEISGISIVLVGNLNPRIFTPDWFARHGLFTAKEAEAAEISVIHAAISHFRMESLTFRVEQERFIIDTYEPPYVRAFDLAVRTFRELLPQTPIHMLGINRDVHFDVGDFETRDRIGTKLAPKEPWGAWARSIAAGDKDGHGGLRSLTMEQQNLDDRPKGYVRAKIEPSAKVGDGRSGIYMQINDHYEVKDKSDVMGSEEILSLLESNFEESLKRSDWIIDQIMKLK